MEKPKIDIYKTLIVNRMVVWGLTDCLYCVLRQYSHFAINDLYSKQLNTVLVLDTRRRSDTHEMDAKG